MPGVATPSIPSLADALHNGRLHGAGLDVTEPEPLPAESPLWDEPHCLITRMCRRQSFGKDFRTHHPHRPDQRFPLCQTAGTVESRAILIRLCRAAGGHRLTLNTDKGRITPLLYALIGQSEKDG